MFQNESFETIGIEETEDSEKEVFAIRKHSIDPTSLENFKGVKNSKFDFILFDLINRPNSSTS